MPEEVQSAPNSGKKRLLMVTVAGGVLVLTLAGILTFYLRTHRKEPVPQPKLQSVLHLDTFVVNLADEDGRTYLRLGIDLGVSKAPGKAEKETSISALPVARDAILSVLLATRSEDLAGVEGKQKLKERLLQSLAQKAPEVGVQEVYLTEFLLQR